uniref:Uncharacterized protein n=1 Tax=Romanomermis culicivorax TaxID=13658 RepID=A0A915KPP9_ROMCU
MYIVVANWMRSQLFMDLISDEKPELFPIGGKYFLFQNITKSWRETTCPLCLSMVACMTGNDLLPNLAKISKVLDERKFMELEQVCKFMPLAYHLAWPHSRAECDFKTAQLLKNNFLNSYTRDGQLNFARIMPRTIGRWYAQVCLFVNRQLVVEAQGNNWSSRPRETM